MRRDYAWNRFYQEEQEQVEQCRSFFLKQLTDKCQDVKSEVLRLIGKAGEQIAKQEKKSVVYLYFSLLKSDIIAHRYTLALQVMDDGWRLDEEKVEVYGNLDFLFLAFERLYSGLNEKKKKYVGDIDRYDIQALMFDELELYSSTIAHYLRYLLRGIEDEAAFRTLPLEDYWIIRWGEYEGETEIVIQQDLQPKTEKEWKDSLMKIETNTQWMAGGYWYQGDFENYDCTRHFFSFICFHQCKLQHIVFHEASFIGARFPESQIENCSFAGADLRDVDFRQCRLETVDFTDADVSGAIFDADAAIDLLLTPEQLSTVYVSEE